MFPKNRDNLPGVRWVPIKNATGETIPAFAAVRVTGTDSAQRFTVAKPNADGGPVWINGPAPVFVGETGVAYGGYPATAQYDDGDGTPAVGETWGAVSGSWKLGLDQPGFRIVGSADTGLEVVEVELLRASTADASSCGIGWGWMFGLQPGTQCPDRRGSCLQMAFRSVAGHCTSLDDEQVIDFEWDDTSERWLGTTDLVVAGDVEVGVEIDVGGPVPSLIVVVGGGSGGDVEYVMGATCGSETDRWVEFVGPNPKTGDTICDDPWADPCEDNTFVVRVTCVPCPNDEYTAAGWYCTSDLADCEDENAVLTCVYYAEDPGPCVYLCGGPYETEEECEAVCVNPGDVEYYCIPWGGGSCDPSGRKACYAVPVGDPAPVGACGGPYATSALCDAACDENVPCDPCPWTASVTGTVTGTSGSCTCYTPGEVVVTLDTPSAPCGGFEVSMTPGYCEGNCSFQVDCTGGVFVVSGADVTVLYSSPPGDPFVLIVSLSCLCDGTAGAIQITFHE